MLLWDCDLGYSIGTRPTASLCAMCSGCDRRHVGRGEMCSVKDPEMQCDSGPTRSPPSGRGIWWSRWKYAEGGPTHGGRSTAPHAAWETLEEFWGWDVNIALDNWHRHVRPSRRRKHSFEVCDQRQLAKDWLTARSNHRGAYLSLTLVPVRAL